MFYALVAVASMLAASITMFSGFGLGTLLLPVFAIFFSAEMAVAATAIVHGFNNLFKVVLVGKHADKSVVLRFGVPAVLAAMVGAGVLVQTTQLDPLFQYRIGSRAATVTPGKLLIAALMALFAVFELVPRLRALRIDRRYLPLGGILSGFFGGLSGHQGALRATFLTKTGFSTEGFVATNAVIGLLVDLVRLLVYIAGFSAARGEALTPEHLPLIATGVIAAMVGVLIGTRYLKKVTMASVQTLTGVLLILIAALLAAGIL